MLGHTICYSYTFISWVIIIYNNKDKTKTWQIRHVANYILLIFNLNFQFSLSNIMDLIWAHDSYDMKYTFF